MAAQGIYTFDGVAAQSICTFGVNTLEAVATQVWIHTGIYTFDGVAAQGVQTFDGVATQKYSTLSWSKKNAKLWC